MIKIENVVLPSAQQWEAVIRGMRNPKNSWDRSDTEYKAALLTPGCYTYLDVPKIGPNDLGLMESLVKGGPVHAKYRRMIPVYLDITAPLYWWKEFDTYRTGVAPNPMDIEMNSCSTMHKIDAKEFTLEDFSCEHLTDGSEENDDFINSFVVMENGDSFYDYHLYPKDGLEMVIDLLNKNRKMFLDTKNKKYWEQMIQLLPSSYNQKRTIELNYEVLSNMYKWRKNHKLDEWREFCKWIESLPYSELITGPEEIKNSYIISLVGCEHSNIFDFELTDAEYKLLKRIAQKANETSIYDCMPRMFVEEVNNESGN